MRSRRCAIIHSTISAASSGVASRSTEGISSAEMVEWMIAHRRERIIGLGMDYRETDHPPEFFWKAYRATKRAGFRLTAHAGEFGCHWRNVETAIDLLEVERIDHGYTVLDNPALARRCAERGIVFTVVPTNSYYLRTLEPARWALDHPIRRMPQAGLLIHPNTDDPPLHRVDPQGCWRMMVDLRRFMLNGIIGSFIPEDDKRGLASTFSAEYERLRAELDTTA
jgi:adenosine deaminase